jgi:hypothetical protein
MDMYGGVRFQMNGFLGTSRHDEHVEDFWNYIYRGILTVGFAAKAFGDEDLFDEIRAFANDFALKAGHDYSRPLNSK